MIRGNIIITLKSDLCVGSGYAYAGIIDSDVVYDKYGLPYIPARRLKGCLREAGQIAIDSSEKGKVEEMFGKRGQSGFSDCETGLVIYDAKITGYEKIVEEIKVSNLMREDVLEAYTSVRAQTSIDKNGVADDKSLRFTRVVNKTDPLDTSTGHKRELTFEAPVAFSDEYESIVEDLAKSLRHIGMDRNRGLGNVICKFEKCSVEDICSVTVKNPGDCADDDLVTLTYTLYTEASVMASVNCDIVSESYINGQTVLGFFAGAYLKDGNKAEDESFERLFLKGGLTFTPLYPSDKAGNIYYPAPGYINKLKKTGKYINVTAINDTNSIEPGNQPKKLRGKYIRFVDGMICEKEVDMDILYHNRHKNDEMDRQLYSSQAISAGQFFTGKINGCKKDVAVTADILGRYPLTFGKSRKAQYGKCRLISAQMAKADQRLYHAKAGERIFVTLASDAIFLDPDTCNYTVRTDRVRNLIARDLKIEDKVEVFGKEDRVGESKIYSEVEVRELSGYYGVWNLRRQSVPVICAGSTFEFVMKDAAEIENEYVGSRNGEGFGAVIIRKNDGCFEISKYAEPEHGGNKDAAQNSNQMEMIAVLLKKKKLAEYRNKLKAYAIKISSGGMRKAVVGRLTLMLNEVVNENHTDILNVENALNGRVEDIENPDKKKQAKELVRKYFHYENNNDYKDLNKDLTEQERVELQIYCLKQALIALKYKLR